MSDGNGSPQGGQVVQWSRPHSRTYNRRYLRIPERTSGVVLDLFCGGGGAAMGYHLAGFDVVGVDIHPHPTYPFRFIQADALSWSDWDLPRLCLVHASPPCQAYTIARAHDEHPRLIEPVREMVTSTGLPYVIENVPGAPLKSPVVLCGSMFGLPIRRHRLFESSFPVAIPDRCSCRGMARCYTVYGHSVWLRDGLQPRTKVGFDEGAMAMGIGWMTQAELCQAIPPAYTWWIGRELLKCGG